MSIYYDDAVRLLELIANSVHERNPNNPNPLFFSKDEIVLVEEWIDSYLNKKSPGF